MFIKMEWIKQVFGQTQLVFQYFSKVLLFLLLSPLSPLLPSILSPLQFQVHFMLNGFVYYNGVGHNVFWAQTVGFQLNGARNTSLFN
jgi:hypothetical protein